MEKYKAMEALLDGSLRSFTRRRLALTALLPMGWLVAFPVYIAIYTSRPLSLAELASLNCACSIPAHPFNQTEAALSRAGEDVKPTGEDLTRAPDDLCGACGAVGGALVCDASELLVATSFAFYCNAHASLALATTSVSLGILIGALLGGTLSDRVGRRPTLLAALFLQSSATLLTSAAPTFSALLILKLITGVGISGVTQAGYTLSAELAGTRLRTPLTIEIWSYCWSLMTASSALLAFAMRAVSWRLTELLIATLPAVYAIAIYFIAPESPRWLHRRGRVSEASAVLESLLGEKRPSLSLVVSCPLIPYAPSALTVGRSCPLETSSSTSEAHHVPKTTDSAASRGLMPRAEQEPSRKREAVGGEPASAGGSEQAGGSEVASAGGSEHASCPLPPAAHVYRHHAFARWPAWASHFAMTTQVSSAKSRIDILHTKAHGYPLF